MLMNKPTTPLEYAWFLPKPKGQHLYSNGFFGFYAFGNMSNHAVKSRGTYDNQQNHLNMHEFCVSVEMLYNHSSKPRPNEIIPVKVDEDILRCYHMGRVFGN